MKKILFTPEQLGALEFLSTDKFPFEDGGYYETFEFEKGNSKITITYEFDKSGTYLTGYIEFNEERLDGRQITEQDILMLKEIM